MRDPQDAAALLKELAVPRLDPVTATLADATGPQALTEALAAILAWPDGGRAALVDEVVRGCARGGGGRRPVRGGLRRGRAGQPASTRATSA